jgi:hypothetical protein
MTVHSLPLPLAGAAPQRLRSGRLKMLLILLVCAAPLLSSLLVYKVWRADGPGVAYSALIQPSVELPDLTARDLDGRDVALRTLKGQWLLLVVAPAACDTACEQRLFMQRQLREMMGRERERVDKVWLVTDAAPVRPELRQALGGTAPVLALRVPRAQLEQWLRPAPGQQLEDHLYIVDPMGEWMMRPPASPDPSKLKRDLERLLRAAAAWDRPGR